MVFMAYYGFKTEKRRWDDNINDTDKYLVNYNLDEFMRRIFDLLKVKKNFFYWYFFLLFID